MGHDSANEGRDGGNLLREADDDDRLTRSITRQVAFVVGATVLLAIGFLSATAHAVTLIDNASIEADMARARVAMHHAIALDAETVAAISEAYQLAGARLTVEGDVRPHEVSLPAAAGPETILAWTPHRLGSDIFQQVAPFRVTAAVALLLGIVFVLRRLHKLTRHLEARRAAARKLAGRDPLTGLANRLEFSNELSRRIAAIGETGQAALVLLDLDGFKAVNDRFGHLAGDALLRETAARLKALASPGDLVARLGGDEFAIIRTEATGRGELAEFAAAVVRLLSAPFAIDNTRVSVTVSIGVARIPRDAREMDAVIRIADAALYHAKERAGGHYEFADYRRTAPAAVTAQRPAA